MYDEDNSREVDKQEMENVMVVSLDNDGDCFFIVDGLIWFIPVPLDEFKNAHSLTIKWAMHWPNLTINSDDLTTVVNSNVGHHQLLAQLLMINLVVVFRRYSTCLKGRG